jgi:hypothetical protein
MLPLGIERSLRGLECSGHQIKDRSQGGFVRTVSQIDHELLIDNEKSQTTPLRFCEPSYSLQIANCRRKRARSAVAAGLGFSNTASQSLGNGSKKWLNLTTSGRYCNGTPSYTRFIPTYTCARAISISSKAANHLASNAFRF